ncbi:hypothetical protein MNBD_GAMMA25-300 [hydrothermal vent metagenome]|uniref:Enoyl-CoA hydratase n=1 Tax=hydrothermal vent metagenome TaxID=652676 RepID=A0A3B1B371_9ZZZZ
MTYKRLQLIKTGKIAEINLCANHFDKLMISEMHQALEFISDETDIRFLIISGRDGVFSKGINFHKFFNAKMVNVADFNRWEKLTYFVQNLNVVTIALIDGVCNGAGIQLALACDLRIASKESVFSHDEIDHGFLPGSYVMQLGKYCGIGRIHELLQSGCSYTAEQAKEMGVINDAVDDLSLAMELRIEQYSKLNIRLHNLTRRLVREAFEMPYNDFLGCCQAAQHQAIVNNKDELHGISNSDEESREVIRVI